MLLLRALSIIGGALIVAGLALIAVAALTQRPSSTLAATVPRGVGPSDLPSATPTPPGSATVRTPTVIPPGPPTGTAVVVQPSTSTPRPAATSTPRPAATATPGRPPTFTPGPAPTPPPGATSTRTPTATPRTCPTAVPTRPALAAAAPPTPTVTPTPAGVPPCRTATPTATPTRKPVGMLPVLAAGLPGGLWLSAETPAALADASSVRLGLNYPDRMQTGQSETISVTLSRGPAGAVVATVGSGGGATVVVSPLPVGTPGAPLQDARGANYAAFAVARIPPTAGVQISLSSPSNEEQSLERDSITWYWSVSSQAAGTRKLRLDLEVRFKPRAAGFAPVPDEPIWSPEIVIDVRDKDVLVLGPLQLPTNTIGQTIVQVGLSSQIPLVLAWVRGKLTHTPPPPTPPPPPPVKRKKRGSSDAV